MYARILAAIDGSPTSDRAFQEAIAFTKNQKANLRLVHIIDKTPILRGYADWLDDEEISGIFCQAGQRITEDALAQARKSDITAESALLETTAKRLADVIIDEANHWRADLVVMGTHGRHGIEHLLLGSVAEGVSRNTSIPLLLICGQ